MILSLYRGEGRLKVHPHWDCENVEELIRYIFACGFPSRAKGHFSGTLAEQILQQGYVNQNTVSLTESFNIAVYYATSQHTRNSGVVFKIDTNRIRQCGYVYDSFGTMIKSCDWMKNTHFAILKNMVEALGVLAAGMFLNSFSEKTRRYILDGITFFSWVPAWADYFNEKEWKILLNHGITTDDVKTLVTSFETFWLYALPVIGSVDEIIVDDSGSLIKTNTRISGRLAYYMAFMLVYEKLEAALDEQTTEYRQPGWDLTPFGYIAKTCRDREFFSTGPVPGHCVVEATIVSSNGTPLQVIPNSMK